MKVEKAVTRLPTWKVAECINRLEDWRDKKPQDGTIEPSNVPGCGEIRASETGLKPLAAGRLFLNIFTKNGRQILVEQMLVNRAKQEKSDTDVFSERTETSEHHISVTDCVGYVIANARRVLKRRQRRSMTS